MDGVNYQAPFGGRYVHYGHCGLIVDWLIMGWDGIGRMPIAGGFYRGNPLFGEVILCGPIW